MAAIKTVDVRNHTSETESSNYQMNYTELNATRTIINSQAADSINLLSTSRNASFLKSEKKLIGNEVIGNEKHCPTLPDGYCHTSKPTTKQITSTEIKSIKTIHKNLSDDTKHVGSQFEEIACAQYYIASDEIDLVDDTYFGPKHFRLERGQVDNGHQDLMLPIDRFLGESPREQYFIFYRRDETRY